MFPLVQKPLRNLYKHTFWGKLFHLQMLSLTTKFHLEHLLQCLIWILQHYPRVFCSKFLLAGRWRSLLMFWNISAFWGVWLALFKPTNTVQVSSLPELYFFIFSCLLDKIFLLSSCTKLSSWMFSEAGFVYIYVCYLPRLLMDFLYLCLPPWVSSPFQCQMRLCNSLITKLFWRIL